MTKALLMAIRSEFEYTSISIEEICDKYDCTTKDLKGYTTWEKNPQDSVDSSVKLIYETLYTPNIEDYIEQDPEVLEAEILHTAEDIKKNKPITKESLPVQVQDGFEGLRKLDMKMQTQALTLLNKIDDMVDNCETAKDVRDLVASHTAIRDSYFNTKAPMVNILNGNITTGASSELATLLDSTQDDC